MNITGMCGECSQCLSHTGFAPAHGVCAFPVYTAQAPGCSVGELSKAGPGLHVLPRSMLLRFRFSGTPQRHGLGWVCVLCPPQVRAAQATRCLASALSQVGGASHYLPAPSPSVSCVRHGSTASGVSCVSSGGLISGCDPPGRWQPSRISEDLLSNWEPAHSLVEDAPRLLALAVAHLPLLLAGRWAGLQPASSPLLFAQSFIL